MCDPVSAAVFKYTSKHHISLVHTTATAHDILAAAAYAGHLPVVGWLHSMGCTAENIYRNRFQHGLSEPTTIRHPSFDKICASAAHGGHLDVLEWLHSEGFVLNHRVRIGAAYNGDIAIFEWLESKRFPMGQTVFEITAALGRLSLLEWLYNSYTSPLHVSSIVAATAAAAGHTPVLAWVYQHIQLCQRNDNIIRAAAYNGHLETVQWLIGVNHSPIYAKIGATEGNHAVIVDWLETHYPDHSLSSHSPTNKIDPKYDVNSPEFILTKCRL